MKTRILSFALFISISSISFCQNAQMVFFLTDYIDSLRRNKVETIDMSRQAAVLTQSKIHHEHVFYFGVVLDAEKSKDIEGLKEKQDKVKKKYYGKFNYQVFMNKNELKQEPADAQRFWGVGNRSTSLAHFKTQSGQLVYMGNENILNYIDNFKDFFLDGDNEVSMKFSFDGAPYAEGKMMYNSDKYAPHGDYCQIGTPKMNDAAYEKQAMDYFKKIKADCKPEAIVLLNTDIEIMKNDLGVPLYRYNRGHMMYRDAAGKLFSTVFVIQEDYAGGGTYGKVKLIEANSGVSTELDEKCLAAYKKKYSK